MLILQGKIYGFKGLKNLKHIKSILVGKEIYGDNENIEERKNEIE